MNQVATMRTTRRRPCLLLVPRLLRLGARRDDHHVPEGGAAIIRLQSAVGLVLGEEAPRELGPRRQRFRGHFMRLSPQSQVDNRVSYVPGIGDVGKVQIDSIPPSPILECTNKNSLQ